MANCRFYKLPSECDFANKVCGTQSSKLTPDQRDYASEFCTLCEGVGCRDKEELIKKIKSEQALESASRA